MTYRYQAVLEYDGRWFAGWQKQAGMLTVQAVMEQALSQLCGHNVEVQVAGRTDAGVHAVGQVVHFDLANPPNDFHLMSGANYYIREIFNREKRRILQALPATVMGGSLLLEQFLNTLNQPISLKYCRPVEDKFHSRFSALGKTYLYRINIGRAIGALEEGYCWHLWTPLDLKLMQQASRYLIGEHDFSSFRGVHCQAHSPIRHIDSIEFITRQDGLDIRIHGNAFLHHMVRNIVGTLVLLSQKHRPPIAMETILLAKQRAQAGVTAPAGGLYLRRVDYPEPWTLPVELS